MKRLTVVITSFNRERYIGASIESVLASEFSDFDLLVLDDASTDATVEVARRYASIDDRVRVVVNERNLGDYGNRNRAIELVATPFLKYHDSDDLMYPYCLGTMMRLLNETPLAGFAMSSGRCWPGGPCPMLLTPKMSYEREFLGSGLFFCGPAGALFRTEVLRGLGGFPNRGAASDFCLWLRACAKTPVLLVPADLFWYRIHPQQEFQSPRAGRDYAVGLADAWLALNSSECPLEGDALRMAKRSFLHRLIALVWRDLRAGRPSLAGLRLKGSGVRLYDLVRYPPRKLHHPIAGTPLLADGGFVVPKWLRMRERETSTECTGTAANRGDPSGRI